MIFTDSQMWIEKLALKCGTLQMKLNKTSFYNTGKYLVFHRERVVHYITAKIDLIVRNILKKVQH